MLVIKTNNAQYSRQILDSFKCIGNCKAILITMGVHNLHHDTVTWNINTCHTVARATLSHVTLVRNFAQYNRTNTVRLITMGVHNTMTKTLIHVTWLPGQHYHMSHFSQYNSTTTVILITMGIHNLHHDMMTWNINTCHMDARVTLSRHTSSHNTTVWPQWYSLQWEYTIRWQKH